MGALNFDPYALLAEIQNQKPTPATVATPATVEPQTRPTVATVAGVAGGHLQISKSQQQPKLNSSPTEGDPEIYLAHLREHGYRPYGAVATVLGWGATRVWQAEARLRASGRIVLGDDGLRLADMPGGAPASTEGQQT